MLHGGQPAHSCERRDWRKVPGSFEGIASLPNANTWWAYPLYINGPSCAVKMLERVPGGGGGGYNLNIVYSLPAVHYHHTAIPLDTKNV